MAEEVVESLPLTEAQIAKATREDFLQWLTKCRRQAVAVVEGQRTRKAVTDAPRSGKPRPTSLRPSKRSA
ncbi:unnamed protein product [Haemonchus placei]|uniref:DUF3606 domain-containing protein n=1 Tax=Haemonchus placei TaxID=6290 RepID=A0A0N4WYY2_HAEPC|nr:unnamed protein product [Haemonchus placei]